jgi:hypothetical protein
MCFSATTSFSVSFILLLTAIAGIQQARKKSSNALINFACMPLFFALQQANEGIIWLALSYHNQFWQLIGSSLYLFFAYVFWPLWIPWSLYALERDPTRKKILACCGALGICYAIMVLSLASCCYPRVSVIHNHISYNIPPLQNYYYYFFFVYCLSVIVPFFMMKNRLFWLLGGLIALAALLTYVIFLTYFTSIWCFFAAILSALVVYIVRLFPKRS